ncbi:hypothetical protein BaRGS_00011267 [Batillaria attramentaria]|uniref:Uncharacterized protein n=1 Tax=Batillaria attramentaria TaxID=370345 RepID=A0ABD0LDL7_9CAEN
MEIDREPSPPPCGLCRGCWRCRRSLTPHVERQDVAALVVQPVAVMVVVAAVVFVAAAVVVTAVVVVAAAVVVTAVVVVAAALEVSHSFSQQQARG